MTRAVKTCLVLAGLAGLAVAIYAVAKEVEEDGCPCCCKCHDEEEDD